MLLEKNFNKNLSHFKKKIKDFELSAIIKE